MKDEIQYKDLIIKGMPASLHRELKIISAKTGKSMKLLIIEAIREKYLNN